MSALFGVIMMIIDAKSVIKKEDRAFFSGGGGGGDSSSVVQRRTRRISIDCCHDCLLVVLAMLQLGINVDKKSRQLGYLPVTRSSPVRGHIRVESRIFG